MVELDSKFDVKDLVNELWAAPKEVELKRLEEKGFWAEDLNVKVR